MGITMPTKFVIKMQGKSGNFSVKNWVRNRGKKKYVTVRKKRDKREKKNKKNFTKI
jgi:hypothetical protein